MSYSHPAAWAERRAQGLCGECGVIESHRYSRCSYCREVISEQRKRWWRTRAKWIINAKRRQQYAELGYRIS